MDLQVLRQQVRLTSLRAFRLVSELGHVTAAAAQLGVTQPAVSQSIAALEAAIGFKLFERGGGKRLVPTPEGRALYDACAEVVDCADALERVVLGLQGAEARCGIGVLPVMSGGFIETALKRMDTAGVGLRATLRTYYSIEIGDRVAGGDVDVGVTLDPEPDDRLTIDPLATMPWVVVLDGAHPLAPHRRLSPADLAGERIVLPLAPSIGRRLVEEAFVRAGIPLDAAMEAPGAGICEFVVDSPAVAIVSPLAAWRYRERGIVARRFAHDAPGRYYLLRRKGTRPAPWQATLGAELIAMFDLVRCDLDLVDGPSVVATRPSPVRRRARRP